MGTLKNPVGVKNPVRAAKTIGIVVAVLVFGVDRTIKILVNLGDLTGHFGMIQFIPLHNYGAMGGTLAHHRILLTGIGLIVLIGLSIMWFRYSAGRYPALFFAGWGFLYGGALGNTFGRLFYGYVTDMFHLPHGRGVFNLADISLQLGILLMAVHYALQPRGRAARRERGEAEDENNQNSGFPDYSALSPRGENSNDESYTEARASYGEDSYNQVGYSEDSYNQVGYSQESNQNDSDDPHSDEPYMDHNDGVSQEESRLQSKGQTKTEPD